MTDDRDTQILAGEMMLDPRVLDPAHELIDTTDLVDHEIDQIVRVLDTIRRWRAAEQRLSQRSRESMGLNETDMTALRYLVVAENENLLVTPSALASRLRISTASTTKLLDRLESAGHIRRSPHPEDRRALSITISRSTHERVRDSVGRVQARRFEAVARLSPAERNVIIRFLDELAAIASESQRNEAEGS